MRHYSHRLGFLKDFLLTKGRRAPEGEALVSMAEWAVVANFLPFLFFFFKIYLFNVLVVVSLCCCPWAFSSCAKQELLSSCCMWVSHCSDSLVAEEKL